MFQNYEKKHGAILILGYLAGDSFSLYQPFMTNDVKDVMYTLGIKVLYLFF